VDGRPHEPTSVRQKGRLVVVAGPRGDGRRPAHAERVPGCVERRVPGAVAAMESAVAGPLPSWGSAQPPTAPTRTPTTSIHERTRDIEGRELCVADTRRRVLFSDLKVTRPETNQQAVALTSPLRIGLVVSGPSRGAADRSRSQNETLRSRPGTGPHGRGRQHPTERISTRFPLDPPGPGPRDASRAQPRMSGALTAYWGSSGRRTRRGRSEMEWRKATRASVSALVKSSSFRRGEVTG